MPVHLRHQPSMDLRSAARADSAAKDSDSFSFAESHRTDSENEMTSSKPSQIKPRSLRLTTSTTMIQKRYQSDEELPSPTTSGSKDSQEEDFDMEDLDDIEVLGPAITATEIAKAIPIVYTGKPIMITISTLAPMHKRQTAPTRPVKVTHAASANTVPRAIPRRSSLRNKLANRTVSMYEQAPARTQSPAPSNLSAPPTINFSAPMRGSSLSPRPSPLSSSSPPQLLDPSSPTSSYPSDSEASSSLDEAEALMRESEEIQIRTHSMERERAAFGEHEEDILGKPPTPTSYEAYDPFGIDPPRLIKNKTREDEGRRWKGLTLGRKVRLGRRGREQEAGY